MKVLSISSSNCLLSRSPYGVDVNGKSISELINEKLPEELVNYQKYSAKINVSIEIWDEDDLNITTTGYEL
ncbi:hypothetical protein [Clostridium cellulovorans]|uniref:Uncharacterized protein n=1 Tax=Clostridium cellulovorans (strain ATCC 35296 / DSM 3052 / OCM 3 / 743B) TaxID=573061 RepID=D9SNT4_CLOC7|nr:hypothetical protein [Clostridium cellulovorans]ADL49955.1 hypothetical protein Clocel_0167 [Clostridium cellulovorans 743B]